MTARERFIFEVVRAGGSFLLDNGEVAHPSLKPGKINKNGVYCVVYSPKGELLDKNYFYRLHVMLLDPTNWKLIGLMRGWKDCEYTMGVGKILPGRKQVTVTKEVYKNKMRNFMDALADTGSIETALTHVGI